MKKIVLFLLLVTLAFAQSYKEFAQKYGYETDYKKALKRAKVEKKDILLVEVTNYCPWCRKLEKKVLASKKVDNYIHKNYIPLIVNREEKKLPKEFDTPIVPVTYVINYKDSKDFKQTRGYKSKNDFLNIIQKF